MTELDAALDAYRQQLAHLHALSHERDEICRKAARLEGLAALNDLILAQRARVRTLRGELDALMRAQ